MNNKIQDYGISNRLNLTIISGLYRSYLRIHRSTQKLIATYNITISQFGVMEVLYHLGDMTIGDIIDKTLSTSGNMTVVIKNLEQEGWITRHTDPRDKRASLVQLTSKGQELIARIFPKHLTDVDGLLANLERQDKEQLISLFKKMNRLE